MKKSLIGASLIVAMLAPLVSFAAVNNVLFDPNGTGAIKVNVGSQATLHLYVDTSATQDLESVFVSFPGSTGSTQQGKCYTLDPSRVGASPAGGWDVLVDVTAPSNAGVFPVKETMYGINGDPVDSTCTGTAVFPAVQFANRITVTDVTPVGTPTQNSGGSPSPTTGGSSAPTSTTDQLLKDLAAQMSSLTASINLLINGGAGGSSAQVCKDLQAYAYFSYGMRGFQVVQAQTYLMSHGGVIPAISSGAAQPGFWGNQSAAAYFQVKAANKCL